MTQLAVHELGTGPTVVMLAGFGLNHRIWDGQVQALSAHRRVVCVDLLGTGSSDKPLTGYDTDTQAHAVLEALKDRGIDSFSLVGHSFGGMVAFAMTAMAPLAVEHLLLVGSNGVRAGRSTEFPFGAPCDRMLAALVEGERSNRPASRRRTLAAGFADDPDPAVLDFLTALSLEMPSWSAIESFHAMFATDQVAAIDSVSAPVSQVVGELDRVHPAAGAQWLQERLAEGSLEVIPGIGHYPMFEAPDALNDFLARALQVTPS